MALRLVVLCHHLWVLLVFAVGFALFFFAEITVAMVIGGFGYAFTIKRKER